MPECPEHPHVAADISELKHAVFGNGQPGLKTRVERMETKLETGVAILWSLFVLAVPSTISVVSIAIAFLK